MPASRFIEAAPPESLDDQTAAEVGRVLDDAERRVEWMLAWMRAAAFVLLVLGARIFEHAEHDDFFVASFIAYGAATLIVIGLAWWRFYHPLTAWILATLDVALVLQCIWIRVIQQEAQLIELFNHPAAVMIFLLLASSAVRYRPAVLAYSFGLFVTGWFAMSFQSQPATLNVRGLPGEVAAGLMILALTAAALWFASWRARRLLLGAFRQARLRDLLARYVSDPVVRELEQRSARQQEVAILFADLRGFTSMAERLEPAAVVTFLEAYRAICERAVRSHGGIVDKFMGDAVMAVFEGTDRQSVAARCVASALALSKSLEVWNSAGKERGEPMIEFGIGAHFGEAIVGTIGRDGRLEYTVVGDAVNTAQRIERLTSELRTRLLISTELLNAAGPEFQGMFRSIGERPLAGRRKRVSLLEAVKPPAPSQVWRFDPVPISARHHQYAKRGTRSTLLKGADRLTPKPL